MFYAVFNHCCYELCCTVTVHDEDKGDHILRVTTYHRDREAMNEMEAEEHAEAIDTCGAFGLYCVFLLSPGDILKFVHLEIKYLEN